MPEIMAPSLVGLTRLLSERSADRALEGFLAALVERNSNDPLLPQICQLLTQPEWRDQAKTLKLFGSLVLHVTGTAREKYPLNALNSAFREYWSYFGKDDRFGMGLGFADVILLSTVMSRTIGRVDGFSEMDKECRVAACQPIVKEVCAELSQILLDLLEGGKSDAQIPDKE